MSSGGENEGAADHFGRLSDDVVLVIFNKLWDAKLLCRCSTVSKRFASLTPRVENLSLSLPSLNKPCFPLKFVNWFLNFFRKPPPNPPKLRQKPPSPFDTLLEKSNISIPLSQFEGIRRLQLELPPYSGAVVGDDYFIWGATKPGYKLECFSLLALTSLDCESEQEELGTQNGVEITVNEFGRRLKLARDCLVNAIRRRWLVEALIRNYPELVSIAINDTNELGSRHCLSGGSLAELKAWVDSVPSVLLLEDINLVLVKWKIWNLCSLRLPVYGGVMEGVTLLVLEFGDDSGGAGCSDAAIMGCFEGEEEAFMEAVAEILTKHKDEVLEYLY